MKKYLLSILLILIFSCSKESPIEPGVADVIVNKKIVKEIRYNAGMVIDNIFEYTYTGNQVKKQLVSPSGEYLNYYIFEYSGENIVKEWYYASDGSLDYYREYIYE
jgi:hypothetical protein